MYEHDDLILVYDVGTTGCKAVLFTPEGEIVASHYGRYETYYPQPTWAEQRPMEWIDSARLGTKAVLSQSKLPVESVKCVGITGTQMGAVPVDHEGRLTRERSIIHCDYRSSREGKRLIDSIGGYDEFYRIHGLGHPPEALSICKVMWLKEFEPKVYNDTYKFLQAKDFVALYLTGSFASDYTDASNTGWLDIGSRKYSEDMLDAAEVDIEKLPELRDSHAVTGHVVERSARETGLQIGTPVTTGAGDTPATCLGAGVVDEGMCYSYIGSANWNGVCSGKPVMDPKIRMINLCHPIPGKYNVFSFTPSGGIVQEWFKDSFYTIGKCRDGGVDTYDALARELSETPPGALGLVCLPYLTGGGGPHWNTNARGSFIGINMLHTRKHFLRSLLEGVALSFRWVMDQTETAGFPVLKWKELRVVGGGAMNEPWLQIYSNVLGMKVSILERPHEATALGAAIAAAVGIGLHGTYEKAAEKMSRVSKIIAPSVEAKTIYDDLYVTYKEAYRSLEPVFNRIAGTRSRPS